MDPDEALTIAREALKNYRELESWGAKPKRDPAALLDMAAEELVDAFEALDGWLSKGGALPAAWKR